MITPPWIQSNWLLIADLQPSYEAAWDSCIIYNRPYDNIFDIIRPEYVRAVARIGSGNPNKRRLEDPEKRLAEHLMTFYARGKLEQGEPEGLLTQFYAKDTWVFGNY